MIRNLLLFGFVSLLPTFSFAESVNVNAAIEFLRQSQNDDGSWGEYEKVGMSSLALSALVRSGLGADDPTVAEGLAYVRSNVHSDGGIYAPTTTHRNYDTALSLMVLNDLDLKSDQAVRERAIAFLKGLQWDESEGINANDPFYGGAGYGGKSRPDLSNTQILLEALKSSGVGPDDPAIQKALIFVSRTQNLESEYNTTAFAGLVDDGGFYYTPAAGGSSQAGQLENGGLRSYASMTYAGLKSLVYAGLSQDDPRVKAAIEWIRKHYTLSENPGLDQQGLFYYYLTFAKSMNAVGDKQFVDADGDAHDWAGDLTTVLAEKQNDDGSWSNPVERWMEGDKRLVTAYALIALSFAK